MKRLFVYLVFYPIYLGIACAQAPDVYVDIWRHEQIRQGAYASPVQVEIYVGTHLGKVERKKPVQQETHLYRLTVTGDTLSLATEKAVYSDQSNVFSYVQSYHYELEAGTYLIYVYAYETGSGQKTSVGKEFIVGAPSVSRTGFSDIALVNNFPVSSFLHPVSGSTSAKTPDLMVNNHTYINRDTLKFYIEVYNAKLSVQSEKFFISARLYQAGSIVYSLSESKETRDFNIFTGSFNIRSLPTRTYQLEIQISGAETGKVAGSVRTPIFIYNTRESSDFEIYTDEAPRGGEFSGYQEKPLDYYIRTLAPVSTAKELEFAQALSDIQQKRSFMYHFWQRRLQGGQRVSDVWHGYLAALSYVNKAFPTQNLEGWQTDRGRIFLQYGIPADVEEYPAGSGSYPYEIWRYERIQTQANVFFIFYANGAEKNNFELIHSNKYGEKSNLRWRSFLEKGLGNK